MKHSDATLGARLVLLVLAEHAHEDGSEAFPKVETIASKARMSRKAVQDALRRLEDGQHIAQTGVRPSGTRIYRILGIAAGENLGEDGDKGAKLLPGRGVDASVRGEESTPDPVDEPSMTRPVDEVLAEAWGKHAPPLMAHKPTYFASARFKRAVDAALKVYELEDALRAIENYAFVVASSEHWFTHRYPAIDFFRRERATPGIDYFCEAANPRSNYFRAKVGNRDAAGAEQRSPAEQLRNAEAWILNTAWRLPLEEFEVAEQLGQRGVEGPDRTRLLGLWRSKASASVKSDARSVRRAS